MVICHNIHVTTSKCLWCEKVDVQQHLSTTTMDQCYQAYLSKFSIDSYPPVITKDHQLLEKLAKTLNVRTLRNENFKNAHRSKEFDIIPPDQSDDIDHHIIVFRAEMQCRNSMEATQLSDFPFKLTTTAHSRRRQNDIHSTLHRIPSIWLLQFSIRTHEFHLSQFCRSMTCVQCNQLRQQAKLDIQLVLTNQFAPLTVR